MQASRFMVGRKHGRKSALSRPAIFIAAAVAARTLGLSLVLLGASCALSASTRVAGRPALRSVLVLREPCSFAQTTPTSHARLAPGRYCAVAQDMGWIYFEGPQMVTKFGLGSPEVLDGGLYIEQDGKEAQAYLVDQLGFRHIYNAHCHYSIEAANACQAGPDRLWPSLRAPEK